MVEQFVLPKSFAMIGSHDHQRPIELAAALQFLEQFAQLFVQISKTIIVRILSQGSMVQGQFALRHVSPAIEDLGIGGVPRPQAEAALGDRGRHIR